MGLSIRFEFHIHINKTGKDVHSGEKKSVNVVSMTGFMQLVEQEIERWKESLSPSTISNYLTALRSFRQYVESSDGNQELCQGTIKGFERWLKNHRLSLNTISCYMRSLRSLLNKVYDHGTMQNMFGSVFTGRTNTEKRSVPESDLMKLRNLKLKPSSFRCLARDLFIFSFFALGMPFIDLAFLKKEQIKGGKLTYYRHKTGQSVTVKLEPCMTEILNRYLSDKSEYVFPIIKSGSSDGAYSEYQTMLNRYNRELKKISELAGIQNRLSSYTPRHTWASIAYSNSIDLHVISKALGHANPKTTLTYIRQIDDSRLECANHSILTKLVDSCE